VLRTVPKLSDNPSSGRAANFLCWINYLFLGRTVISAGVPFHLKSRWRMTAISSFKMHYQLFGLAGVVKRASASIKNRYPEFIAKLPDRHGAVHIRLHTTDVIVFQHVFVNRGYDFKLDFTPKIIVDIGANVGLASVFFALKYPMARIISVEPEPSNFSVLVKNARLFPQIEPLHAAIWDRSGSIYMDPNVPFGHCGAQVDTNIKKGNAVNCVALTDLISQFGLTHIDILKIDAEGAECEILQTAAHWRDRVSLICAELHERLRPGCNEAFAQATTNFSRGWKYDELCCVDRFPSPL
jgi:FkbM family methyltransferase